MAGYSYWDRYDKKFDILSMGYYLGQFYFDKRDLFLVVATVVILFALRFGYPIPYFNVQHLLFLLILFFIAKGLILPTHDSAIYVVFLIALGLTLYVPLFHALVFLLFAFIFLRLLKAI